MLYWRGARGRPNLMSCRGGLLPLDRAASTELRPQRNGNGRWGCGYLQPIRRLRADRWRVGLI